MAAPLSSYRCTYSMMWTAVRYSWGLPLQSPEKTACRACSTPGAPEQAIVTAAPRRAFPPASRGVAGEQFQT